MGNRHPVAKVKNWVADEAEVCAGCSLIMIKGLKHDADETLEQ
jgi:hypothetical protein